MVVSNNASGFSAFCSALQPFCTAASQTLFDELLAPDLRLGQPDKTADAVTTRVFGDIKVEIGFPVIGGPRIAGSIRDQEIDRIPLTPLRQIHRVNIHRERNVLRQSQGLEEFSQTLAEGAHALGAQHDLVAIVRFLAQQWRGGGAGEDEVAEIA